VDYLLILLAFEGALSINSHSKNIYKKNSPLNKEPGSELSLIFSRIGERFYLTRNPFSYVLFLPPSSSLQGKK